MSADARNDARIKAAALAQIKKNQDTIDKLQASQVAAKARDAEIKAQEKAEKELIIKENAAIRLARIRMEREAKTPVKESKAGTSFSTSTFSTFSQQSPQPFAATPTNVSSAIAAIPTPPVKTAPIDTVIFDDEEVSDQVMADLIFEDIGGHELINIARNDIINGQDISYQPIKNLSSLQQQYNPNNILSLQSTSDKYFANFSIKLENKTPNVGNGPFGSNVYIDTINGSLTVDVVNMEIDEQVEIEITTSGTIYEAYLNGSE